MNLKKIILIIIITTIIIISISSVEAHKNEAKGIVSYVHDGDTIYVDNIGKIRLWGIDAPEWNTKKGKQVTKIVKKKLLNKKISLDFDNKKVQDKYGRYLAKVYLNGKDFNKWLYDKKYAKSYYISPSEFKRYGSSEKKTKKYVYIASKYGKKYHYYKDCYGLRKSKSTIKVSLSYAKKKKYRLCGYEN